MHEEKIQNTLVVASEETLWQRTRKGLLAGSLAVSTLAYEYSVSDSVPRSEYPILDIHEHAAHLAPGILLGYAGVAIAERIHGRAQHYARYLSVAAVTTIAGAFETQVSDMVWYRNTTKDIHDVLYTVAAGIIGAFCVRKKTK